MDHTNPQLLRVLIVDDNPMLCTALEHWLSREPGIAWVHCQTDPARAEEEVRARRPDIVLLDIDMPGVSGVDLIAPLLAACPAAKVVLCSGMVSRGLLEQALDNGASGYVLKDQEPRTILQLIRQAAAGEVALCPTAQAALARG